MRGELSYVESVFERVDDAARLRRRDPGAFELTPQLRGVIAGLRARAERGDREPDRERAGTKSHAVERTR
jgi:hypothetical protein